jgi:CheY-like chemotaxis protein
VAHDFNNMLNVILGHTDLVLDDMPANDYRRVSLQEIRDAASRSAELTRQLLGLARKQTVSPRELNLNTVIAGMLKMLRRLIGEDRNLVWNPGDDIGLVNMDPVQIDQILANLVVNARDASDQSGLITIETGMDEFDTRFCHQNPGFMPGKFVYIQVSDNGRGMSQDEVDRVFEPFYTTKEVGEGTGLGLATTYGIVKQNNGFIDVESEQGEGSVFTIYLPALNARKDHATQGVKADPELVKGSETILFVEDEKAILKLGIQILQRLGYYVLPASTPGEALELAKTHSGSIDLLITDVVMPEMNGRELASRILTLYPDIKRLFMSGYTADVIAHHGVLDPGVQFLQKPFSMADLSEAIRRSLSDN